MVCHGSSHFIPLPSHGTGRKPSKRSCKVPAYAVAVPAVAVVGCDQNLTTCCPNHRTSSGAFPVTRPTLTSAVLLACCRSPFPKMNTRQAEVPEPSSVHSSRRFPTHSTLGYASAVIVIICCAIAYRWPLLHSGFYMDDFLHLEMLEGRYPLPRHALNLFSFTEGRQENDVLRSAGFLPWWSHPEVKLALFRPFASALIGLDHSLFGHDAFAFHLHTLLWWTCLIVSFAAVLRELLPHSAALLALLFVVAQPAHNLLLGWLASRNTIAALTLVLSGFWAHLQIRSSRAPSACVALGCLAGAAYLAAGLSSEYAFAVLPYPAAYAFWQARLNSRSVIRVAMLWGIPAATYMALRSALGYGARHSGMYIDPIAEPLAYLHAALVRLPLAAGEVVLAMRASWFGGIPWPDALRALTIPLHAWPYWQISLGTAAVGLGAFIAFRGQRQISSNEGSARFVLFAMPFTFVPILSTLPDSRILMAPILGWAILLSQALRGAFAQLRSSKFRVPGSLCCFALSLTLWLLGSVAAPLCSAGEIQDLPRLASVVRAGILNPNLDEIIGGRRVLLIAAAEPTTFLLPMVRSWSRRSIPASFQVLGQALGPQTIERLSDHVFAIEEERVIKLAIKIPDAFNRDGAYVGQTMDVDDLHVTVEQVIEGRTTRARFSVDRQLDSYVLLLQTSVGLKRVEFPAVGERIVVPAPVHPVDLRPEP